MFDLEKEIENWCDRLQSKRWFNKAQMAELRDHLEQEIRKQQALGIDEKHAFQLAVEKLGETNEIAKEFLKIQFLPQMTQFFAESTFARKIVAVFLIFGAWEMLLKLSFMIVFDYNRSVAVATLFVSSLIIYWTRRAGLALWRGESVNYAGLLLFYLIQIPVTGFASFNYEFYYGISLLMEFGHIDSVFDFAFIGNQHRSLIDVTLAGNFNLNVPFDNSWFRGNYFAINLYALFASVYFLCNLVKQHNEIVFEEPAVIIGTDKNSGSRRGLIKKPIKTFK